MHFLCIPDYGRATRHQHQNGYIEPRGIPWHFQWSVRIIKWYFVWINILPPPINCTMSEACPLKLGKQDAHNPIIKNRQKPPGTQISCYASLYTSGPIRYCELSHKPVTLLFIKNSTSSHKCVMHYHYVLYAVHPANCARFTLRCVHDGYISIDLPIYFRASVHLKDVV